MQVFYWLTLVANIQTAHDRGVTPKDLQAMTGYTRQTVHRHLNELLRIGAIIRISRGKYILNEENQDLRNIGFCVLLPMDVYEFKSIQEYKRRKRDIA